MQKSLTEDECFETSKVHDAHTLRLAVVLTPLHRRKQRGLISRHIPTRVFAIC